jgi:hypothetical protein
MEAEALIDTELPVACDLLRLNDDQRKREQELLRKLRKQWVRESETEEGIWFSLGADPGVLTDLGELLGLERLCCPFLTFRLEVTRDERCRLYVRGPAGAKDFILGEFTEQCTE